MEKEKIKRYISLSLNRTIRTFPFSSITELEDFSNCPENPRLILVLNNGNRYEIRKNIEKIREMVLGDWKMDGVIIDPDTNWCQCNISYTPIPGSKYCLTCGLEIYRG